MAPVKVVEVFECYNLNPQKFELLLHTFFGKACLNVDVYDKQESGSHPENGSLHHCTSLKQQPTC
jgi:hypothetical protein